MSLFDIFKSKWSSRTMTQDDRKKLFWYLKRRTSYTAWKREADSFDIFSALFEKQVKEEPVVRNGPYKTTWDISFPEVLKGQLLYEQALARLLQGDRTIFLYNDRGAMDDARTISGYWYTELVNNGMRGDHFHEGKYAEDLTQLMREFSLACQDAGYIQSMMADTPAWETWSTWWEEKFAKLPIPANLPDVPEPTKEVLVRTNEEVPVFGIYEPQIKDGCMNYLLGGTPAPKIWETDGTYATDNLLSVTWRLIWEDTRYLDGKIPEEEDFYFPAERITPPSMTAIVTDDSLSAPTGAICTKSGAWAVMDDLNAKVIFNETNLLPQYKGRDVVWVWVSR